MANKHTMRYSKSLITREMQMKTPRCHFTLIRVVIIKSKQKTSVGKNMETMEPLYIAGERVKWYSYCGNNVVVPQKKSSRELLHDPAILLLGIYTKEPKAGLKMVSINSWLIVALFIPAKRWKPNVHLRVNNSRKKEGMEPKQKQHPVVHGNGDRSNIT